MAVDDANRRAPAESPGSGGAEPKGRNTPSTFESDRDAVHAEREELARMLTEAPQALLLLDPQLRLVRFSKAAADIFDLTDAARGAQVSTLSLPVSGLDSQVERARGVGARVRAEVPHTDGRWFVRDVSPSADHLVLCFGEQSPAHERLRLAARVAQVGTFEWLIPSDLNLWSPELEALYGLPPGAFAGSYAAWRRCVHPDDIEQAEARVQESLETGSFSAEWRAVWPDGSVRWIEARAWVEKDARGAPLRMVGVNLDITARMLAEAAQRESEERHRLALASGSLGTFTCHRDSRRVSLDARACAIFGLSDEATLCLESLFSAVHPEDRDCCTAALLQALSGERPCEVEMRVVDADEDAPRWVHVSGTLVHTASSPAEPCLIGIAQDVTQRKEAEDALKSANRRKDEYLAMLGHELRNPLAAIRTTGEFIRMINDGSAELDRAQAVLERQSAHMATLLDGLLDVARITAGKLHVEKAELSLSSVLRDVVSDRMEQASRQEVHLQLDLPDDDLWLRGDVARLTQIFDNLVGNALKFTEPHGHVKLSARRHGAELVVEVCDDGAGFEPDMAEMLFEAFQQGPQDLARTKGGLGLGLALARDLVNLHGGTLSGHSAGVGLGATFSVRLPASAQSRPERSAPQTNAGVALDILVIEDNPDSAPMLLALLGDAGHRMRLATRGRDALRMAFDRCPDVVLCDLGLPDGMNGFEVARALRQRPDTQGVRLIALSGYGRVDDKRRAQEAGFDAHLTKPVNLETLQRTLR